MNDALGRRIRPTIGLEDCENCGRTFKEFARKRWYGSDFTNQTCTTCAAIETCRTVEHIVSERIRNRAGRLRRKAALMKETVGV